MLSMLIAVSGVGILSLYVGSPSSIPQQSAPAPPAAPPDAETIHSEIHAIEALPQVPEHGAKLFFLARLYARTGELPKALALLKECAALDEGFDPGAARGLRVLKDNAEFQELVEQALRRRCITRTWCLPFRTRTCFRKGSPWIERSVCSTWAV